MTNSKDNKEDLVFGVIRAPNTNFKIAGYIGPIIFGIPIVICIIDLFLLLIK